MLYWKEIIKDLAKILTWFCSTCLSVYMTKLQMFYVWAFCHTTDINTIPWRWIGRSTDENMALTCWPPRSQDLTPCDFFLWGCIKDRVFVPPLPVSLNELKHNSCCKCWQRYAQVCLDRIRLSYWYMSCDKRLTHRTFVTTSCKLKNLYYKTM